MTYTEPMKIIKNILWVIPLLVLIYMYGNEGVGVLMGSTEHYDLLAGLGFSAGFTHLLTWVSVVIDLGTALLLLFYPTKPLFIFAAVWVWVPYVIGLIGHVDAEFSESAVDCVLAILSYWAYTRGHYLFKVGKKNGIA